VIHPDWNIKAKNYDADIALAILKYPIQFDGIISPVCLPLNSKKPVVGLKGSIGGWSFPEKYVLQEKPKIIKQRIENKENCLKNEKLLKTLMSNRSFCSAWDSGPGLCSGMIHNLLKLFSTNSDFFQVILEVVG
jgi:hypothetical protein